MAQTVTARPYEGILKPHSVVWEALASDIHGSVHTWGTEKTPVLARDLEELMLTFNKGCKVDAEALSGTIGAIVFGPVSVQMSVAIERVE